jgi:methylenetetrahydrofolate--tRNA-(uracil-5-)-methyltransferase
MDELIVVGGGLAGCEAAWQAANQGLKVTLFEMRPEVQTGAHKTSGLGELVCSNLLGSNLPENASGLLIREAKKLGSLLVEIAENCADPAGSALAVDRHIFTQTITEKIENHPNIAIERSEVTSIPEQPAIIASGPLTSEPLAGAINALTGGESLYFYDALSPIVKADSVNMESAFLGSRLNKGERSEGDYLYCPLNKDEYGQFVKALLAAETVPLRAFESDIKNGVQAGHPTFFETCLPIEELARRGHDTLTFGPMRPTDVYDPKTDRRPHAVVPLRRDDLFGELYHVVGFHTNLRYTEQDRALRMIPGLEKAEFIRYGEMHRNTYINSPQHLTPALQFNSRDDLFFAGQIVGIEGYPGNIATGLLAGLNAARTLKGQAPLVLPVTTMLGALMHYITHSDARRFQPMKANFGIFPPHEEKVKSQPASGAAHARRALKELDRFIAEEM